MKFLKLIAFVLIPYWATAQYYDEIRGAKNASLGYVSNVEGAFSIYNNPSFAVFTDSNLVALDVQNRFGVADFSTVALAGHYKFNALNGGILINQFGSDLYKEQGIHLSAGKKLSNQFALGIRFSYQIISVENRTRQTELSPLLCSSYREGNWLFSFKYQFFRLLKNENITEKATQNRVNFGAVYLTDLFNFYSEIDFIPNQKPDFKLGAEFILYRTVYFRLGSYNTFSGLSFGLGFQLRKITIDVASTYQNQTGLSPQISVAYAF